MLNTFDKWATSLIGSAVIIAVSVVFYFTPPNSVTTIERALASTVKVTVPDGRGGAGVVVSDKGLILTNAHVCGDDAEFKITRSDGRQVRASKLWSSTQEYDLCMLKTHDLESTIFHGVNVDLFWTPAIFATAEAQYGDEVNVMGHPLGLAFSMSRGIVSHPNQTVPISRAGDTVKRIQIDAVLAPGNSGGPLWNANYELIGISNSGRTMRGVTVGLNFAIPISMVREVLAQ
jgi:putative serine protease PepD